MSDHERPRYQFSADRTSARRTLRYRETNQGDAAECRLCQLDEGQIDVNDAVQSNADDDDDEDFAAERLLEAVQNQIDADSPPAARATFNKLTLVGYPAEEALELMAQVLAHEVSAMLDADRPFDLAWYEQALRALPTLPDEA